MPFKILIKVKERFHYPTFCSNKNENNAHAIGIYYQQLKIFQPSRIKALLMVYLFICTFFKTNKIITHTN